MQRSVDLLQRVLGRCVDGEVELSDWWDRAEGIGKLSAVSEFHGASAGGEQGGHGVMEVYSLGDEEGRDMFFVK
jgi:hypothetical protein